MSGLERGSVAVVGAAESDLGQVAPDTSIVDLMAQATMRALEVRPEDRLGSAGELEQALSDALDQAAGFGAAQVGSWVVERFPE